MTTDPPPAYMVQDMEEQIKCAKKAGFVIKKPTLRIMRPPFAHNTPHGFAYMDENLIILIPYASYEILAHELGHIVDAQTGREGPLFDHIRDLELQAFANAIRDIILNECKPVFPSPAGN